MLNYCTLFDSHYLSRGLAMIGSLQRSADTTVYVLCMDGATYEFLRAASSPRVIPILLSEFEDDDLRRVKPDRSKGEYCWTCTSSLIGYCIRKFGLDECIYVDADLYFFRPPIVIHERMEDAGVLITPHRFSAYCNRQVQAGIFCVQYLSFRISRGGGEALAWWRERCLEWCYARVEANRFGDQKYLDDWPQRFRGVHVANDPDTGMAPWNAADYRVVAGRGVDTILQFSGQEIRPIFYHFHGVKLWRSGLVDFGTNYQIGDDICRALYEPYLDELISINRSLPTEELREAVYEPGTSPRRLLLKRVFWQSRGTCNLLKVARA